MIRRIVMASLMIAAPIVPAAAQIALHDGAVADIVTQMKPGDYLWAPDIAPGGPVVIVVSIPQQRAYAYRNGIPIGITTVSTGKKGHETPTGVFTLLQKNIDHKSNLYNSAPMPYMQRLTWDGIAMHAGNLPGYPASHGCVRMPLAFSKLLYGITKLGLTVIITNDAQVPRVAPTPAFMAKGAASHADEWLMGGSLWQPERSTTGPVSIIVSAADKRMLILRNGVPIGSAPVHIHGDVPGATAYTLTAIEGETYRWSRLPLPGQGLSAPTLVSQEERDRLVVPEDIRLSMASVVTPGTTVVVTPDTLRSGGTGTKMTVLTTDKK
ncbi:L,D-transpeptidase [Sphingomonas montanisoli]|uniref:L,D-transpeptidase n=1 Tax=Sphingomonas montanisoli TaxID=2606412 RepID=A0A5D9C829_9SPHN|nr:L,D-transpeptidase [Sphingomonas montanisoli]TZG26225.1 L,D-transpeptidase [Sphingomonas montanisoli]